MDSTARFWLTGDLKIDLLTKKAYYNQTEVKLSDLSFKTMVTLVKAFPHSLSNDELIEQVWQQTAVSPETVTQRVALIRKALLEAGLEPKRYLAATRHIGYRWQEPVIEHKKSSKKKTLVLYLLMCAFVLIGFAVLWKNLHTPMPVTKPSATVSAQDLTNQAWSYLDKHNAQSNQLAIGLFRQALAVNDNDVNALTGFSIALSHEVTKFNQSADFLTEARAVALKATTLDSTHAQAWAALAFVDDAAGDIDAAIKGYEKAVELAPTNSSTVSSLAYLYAVKGRLVEAMKLNVSVLGSKQLYLDLQIAQTLNLLGFDVLSEQWYYKADVLSPDNVFATHQRAQFYLAKNQQSKAKAIIEQAQKRGIIRPELPTLLGLMDWKNGEKITAYNHFKSAYAIDDGDIQSFLLMQSISTKNQIIKTQAHEWLTTSLSWPAQSIYQAQFYAVTGEDERAFKSLQHAFKQGYRDYAWLQWVPAFEQIRSDDRWSDLMLSMQKDVAKQRQQLLKAGWLPTSFLDPQN